MSSSGADVWSAYFHRILAVQVYLQREACFTELQDRHLTYLLKELSPNGGSANSAASQDFPSILLNAKVHYRVHKSPPLAPTLSLIYPIHTIPSHPISLRSILILSTHLRIGLPCGLFLLTFPPISYTHSSSLPFVLHALPTSSSLTWSFLDLWGSPNLLHNGYRGLFSGG
jgi:hypothetical protein